MVKLKLLSVVSCLFLAQTAFGAITWTKESDGIVCAMPNSGTMKIQVCSESIIRVVYTLASALPAATNNYIVVKGTWDSVSWTASETATAVSVLTSAVRADVDKTSGAVSFFTASGTPIVQETQAKTLTKTTISGQTAYTGSINFNSTSGEGIYGMGQFQNGVLNQAGQTIDLVQQNQTDCSPVLLSTRGFGILWINYSAMKFTPPLSLTCTWATNDAIDYYFMYGPSFDKIIASYRTITGPTVMWPKWAYGFWQCRNAYASQTEILNVVKQYRAKKYPIDNIVQDWGYYPAKMSGCACFDPGRYPDPAGMIKQLHDSLNCHFTISVWPSYTADAGNANYTFMNSKGYLLSVSDYLGRTYDAFSDSAAFYYWKFINEGLVSKDIDAFWPDATEPESIGWTTCNTSAGPAAKVQNIFPLLHSRTLYNGYRSANKDRKRVCNLTRSYYAGSQRLGAAYWTGDIGIDWQTYAKQVPAGLNVCMTGLPLFCTDVGGFTGDNQAETEIRWFQYGAFNPVFRVHGTRACNEVWCWNNQLPKTEEILVNYSKLRYRLFPYVYSLAWRVTNEGYTMMRALPFDFPDDPIVRNISTEFMFGPSLLICPITAAGVTSTTIYLPAAKWYNFWSGKDTLAGTGKQVVVRAPLDTMPIFVRAGSILPMGPEITYADTAADPIELRVYTGANGSFTLYEDEGDNYSYEKGVYATIPITWDEANQNLTFGSRSGSFPGMLTNRTFNVVWVSSGHGVGQPLTANADKVISYNGEALTLNKTTGGIGVIDRPNSGVIVSHSARLSGRKYIVTLTGRETWSVRLINPLGKVIASREFRGISSGVVADKLAPGMYLAQFKYGKRPVSSTAVIVP